MIDCNEKKVKKKKSEPKIVQKHNRQNVSLWKIHSKLFPKYKKESVWKKENYIDIYKKKKYSSLYTKNQ